MGTAETCVEAIWSHHLLSTCGAKNENGGPADKQANDVKVGALVRRAEVRWLF